MTSFAGGFVAAFLAAVFYGVQYVPCKKYQTFDGSMFQWFMCSGILISGLCLQLFGMVFLNWPSSDPQLILHGVVAGIIWGCANYLVIPLVKLVGLALGFSFYHVINLTTGYVTGRFGLFGVISDSGRIPWLRDLGVFVLIASFIVLFFVEPEPVVIDDKKEKKDKQTKDIENLQNRQRSVSDFINTDPLRGKKMSEFYGRFMGIEYKNVHSSEQGVSRRNSVNLCLSNVLDESCHPSRNKIEKIDVKEKNDDKKVFFTTRKISGIFLAIFAGLLTGLNAVPFDLWKKTEEGERMQPIQFVFSQCVGVYFASTLLYLLYSLYVRVSYKSHAKHTVIKPAMLSGLFWTIGDVLMLFAIDGIGYATGYTLDAVGPVMIASLLSIFVFDEIRDRNQRYIFFGAFILQLLGCLMISCGT